MVPIVYPVLHAHIFSYLFIIYVITHAWTSPESIPAIANARSSWTLYLLIYSIPLYHTCTETEAHTRTHTYTREMKLSSRDLRRPSAEEIGSTIIARLSSSTHFPLRKNGKEQSVGLVFFSIILAALIRIYKKLHMLCRARECGIACRVCNLTIKFGTYLAHVPPM